MESSDVIATPEGAVKDSIIKVCCKGLLDKGLLSRFYFGEGGEYLQGSAHTGWEWLGPYLQSNQY